MAAARRTELKTLVEKYIFVVVLVLLCLIDDSSKDSFVFLFAN